MFHHKSLSCVQFSKSKTYSFTPDARMEVRKRWKDEFGFVQKRLMDFTYCPSAWWICGTHIIYFTLDLTPSVIAYILTIYNIHTYSPTYLLLRINVFAHISPQLFEEAIWINQHSRSGFVIETPLDNG